MPDAHPSAPEPPTPPEMGNTGASLRLAAADSPGFGGALRGSGSPAVIGDSGAQSTSASATQTKRTHPSVVDVQSAINAIQGSDSDARSAAADFLAHVQSVEPKHPLAAVGLGMLAAQANDLDTAMAQFQRAHKAEPRLHAPLLNIGIIHRMQGRRQLSEGVFKQVVDQQPDLPEGHYNLSILQDEAGDLAAARESLERALLFRPGYGEAHNNLGHVLLRQGLVERAVSHFRQALVWQPQLETARTNLILGLYRLGRAAEAHSEVDRALAEHRDINAVLRVQATGLAQLGHLDDAEAIGRRVLEAAPGAFDVDIALGQMMLQRGEHEAALAHYRTMLQQRRAPPVLLLAAMAQAQWAQGNYSQAREQYQQALMLDHGQKDLTTQITLGMARTLVDSGDVRQGIEALRKVVRDSPNHAEYGSALLHALRLDINQSPAALAEAHADWWQRHGRHPDSPTPATARKDDRPLRVGLLVGDIESPQSALPLKAWAQHGQRDQVALFVYHNAAAGPVAKALQAHVANWRAAQPLGNTDLAEQIRADSLDVLIDLCGHEPAGRMQPLSDRGAPWMLAWGADAQAATSGMAEPWGRVLQGPFPDTHDAGDLAMDVIVPAGVLWQAPNEAADAALPERTPAQSPTLAIRAPLSHLHRDVLDTLADIMRAVPDARLHLLSDIAQADSPTIERLRRQLVVRDVEADRLTVIPRRAPQDRIGSLQDLAACDVLLDTWPENLAAALLDALWCGLEVVSLQGTRPSAEHAVAVLRAAGQAAAVCDSVQSYRERAVALMSAQALAEGRSPAVRQAKRTAVISSPAADAAGVIAAMEQALLMAWKARSAGPRHSAVPGDSAATPS